MRAISLTVLLALGFALAAAPAEAAKRTRYVAAQAAQGARGQAGVVVRRSRTRITVTRRSYLDAGTEVYPGSMHYTDYVFSPSYISPSNYTLGPGRPDGEPVPGTEPHWLPSYHRPNWGY